MERAKNAAAATGAWIVAENRYKNAGYMVLVIVIALVSQLCVLLNHLMTIFASIMPWPLGSTENKKQRAQS